MDYLWKVERRGLALVCLFFPQDAAPESALFGGWLA
jgi:hypothetical protein